MLFHYDYDYHYDLDYSKYTKANFFTTIKTQQFFSYPDLYLTLVLALVNYNS